MKHKDLLTPKSRNWKVKLTQGQEELRNTVLLQAIESDSLTEKQQALVDTPLRKWLEIQLQDRRGIYYRYRIYEDHRSIEDLLQQIKEGTLPRTIPARLCEEPYCSKIVRAAGGIPNNAKVAT